MATNTFNLEILTPLKRLVRKQVSEVVLPAHDGQVGILDQHEDFVGLLGTGALKYVSNGNDEWCLVSQGAFAVQDGNVKVLAEVGMESDSIQTSGIDDRVKDVDKQIASISASSPEYQRLSQLKTRLLAMKEIHRRANVAH